VVIEALYVRDVPVSPERMVLTLCGSVLMMIESLFEVRPIFANFAVVGRSSGTIVLWLSCFMVLTPAFFTRMVMEASAPGQNSLVPRMLAENEGLPPRYLDVVVGDPGIGDIMVTAQTGAMRSALQMMRAIIAKRLPGYVKRLVEIMTLLLYLGLLPAIEEIPDGDDDDRDDCEQQGVFQQCVDEPLLGNNFQIQF